MSLVAQAATEVAFLRMLVVGLLAGNVLLAVIVILAWRWRSPGAVARENLTRLERAALHLVGEG